MNAERDTNWRSAIDAAMNARAKIILSERVDYWVHITWSVIIVVVGTLLGVGLTAIGGLMGALVGYFIIAPLAVSFGHMIGLLP